MNTGLSTPLPDDGDPLDWEERAENEPFWRHAMAGSCAGIAEHVGMFPLDTVKTRMQVDGGSVGARQAMRTIVSELGFRGFFRGASVIGIGCVPAHCGLFTTYELGKKHILTGGHTPHPLRMAACGALASTVHDVILTPTDVIKQRLQLGCYRGPFDCLRSILHTEGVFALYRSLPVTLVSNAPNTAVLAVVNEGMKNALGLNRGSHYSDLPWFFFSAGVGGAVAAAMTLPLDVVKTRLQTDGAMNATNSTKPHSGMRTIVSSIWQNEGVYGFYKGFAPRILMATPAAAMCWGTYESVRSSLCYACDDEASPDAAARIAAWKAVEAADVAASVAGLGDDSTDDPYEWEHWHPLEVPLWKHFVAGSVAGIMEHVAMYPVDTVKTKMQAAPFVPGTPPLTVRQTVLRLTQENGVGALFRGCTAIGAACIPAHIGLFGTYELTKLWLLKSGNEKEHAPLKAAACGALSTMVHDSIIVPMDVVKQRLQLGCYKNAYDCISHTCRHEGVIAFYRSLPSTLIMECPFYAILVASNESLKLVLGMEGASRSDSRAGMAWHFASAGVSGIIASAITQPLDVVKTRLQTQEVHHHTIKSDAPASDVRYRGLLSTSKSIFLEEGPRGFFRGAVPRMVFAAPSAALCWGTYEAVKIMLSNID